MLQFGVAEKPRDALFPAIFCCSAQFIFSAAVMLEIRARFRTQNQWLVPESRCYRRTAKNSGGNSGKFRPNSGLNSKRNSGNSKRPIQRLDEIGFEGGRTKHGRSDDMTEQELESKTMPTGDAGGEPGKKRSRGRPFVKGRSGNPAGRPVGRFATGAPGDRLRGADRPTRAAILEEAYRLVTVEEGEEAVMLPANQAVFRALTTKALNGSQIAQRRWTEIVQQAELEQMQDQLAIYNVMERPPFGHEDEAYEDDILVDRRSGTVVIRASREADGEQ